MLPKSLLPVFTFFWLFLIGSDLQAYSVLSHQAMIDAAWEKHLVPALERKFPGATAIQLKEAHAYAYGGAIVPDMGYYPLGSIFFTDLVHYVRTGDFIRNLISEATNRNELAFAYGALAHYYGDVHGHQLGTNRSVPLVYPKTRKYYGNVVTYYEDPVAHMRMEFGFDVLQAARGNYAPEAFRDFIGFKIARETLERAFYKTYGIKLRQTFIYLPLAERVFRGAVKGILPQFTKVGWEFVDDEVKKNADGHANQEVARQLRKSSFHYFHFGYEEKPGATARVMAMVLRYFPKIGVLAPLSFDLPTPEAEKLFAASFEASLRSFELALNNLPGTLPHLPDKDLDTGLHSELGEYPLADCTIARLLHTLADDDFETASVPLQQDLLQYFAELPPPPDYRLEKKQYRKTKASLQVLENHQKKGRANAR